MERILDTSNEFDIQAFEEVVRLALSPGDKQKREAEQVLLQFKEMPSSWTRIDFIIKNSQREQSKFIALQILEENVKSRWSLFNEEMKTGLRQYVFSTAIELSVSSPGIILQKFNVILVEIVKRDWPRKWPTFISDLITVSQSTSMAVTTNSLEIFRMINEEVFLAEDKMTTTKKRLLRNTLQQEYFAIFRFISLILEYSETQELEDKLLESCLYAFRSFCCSMPLEFVFSTRIVDHVLVHLNSPHSIAALDCLLEIIELERGEQLDVSAELEGEAARRVPRESSVSVEKIRLIHSELLNFFALYMRKFEAGEKLSAAYKKMAEQERIFLKKYAKIFATTYTLWMNELDAEGVQQGLGHLVEICKIDDISIFQTVFFFWYKFIHSLYAEYPMRVETARVLKRDRFTGVLQAMLPVFVQSMPKPEEVFILVNDLGEIVRDRKVETSEIEFYKKMKTNLFNISYLIEEFIKSYFIKKMEKHINGVPDDTDLNTAYRGLNQLCWGVGALAGAFDEAMEREFFVSTMNTLLTICELRNRREERAIVASNIMFIIGQYHRFLKYNCEFLFVVLRKLFEFMAETYEGVKEMACDNFFKICEKCPNQFFQKKNGQLIFDVIIADLGSVTRNLDFYLQRTVLEGLLIVLKDGPKKDLHYIEVMYASLTNQGMLSTAYIDNIQAVITDRLQLMMMCHLAECYLLGFKILPEIFHQMPVLEQFIYMFSKATQGAAASDLLQTNSLVGKNTNILRKSLAELFKTVVESRYADPRFYVGICAEVIVDFRTSLCPSLLQLAEAVVTFSNTTDADFVQRLHFFNANLIAPGIPSLLKADENPELSILFLSFFSTLLESNFAVFFPILMEFDSYEPLMNALFFSLTSLREISIRGLEALSILCKLCFENRVYRFFSRFYIIALENILGLLFDNDHKSTYTMQVDLFYHLLSYLPSLPSLDPTTPNVLFVRGFISSLFSKNFKNITENALKIFVDGIFEIKNEALFKEHLDDFNVKIYEFGDDEDTEAEYALLRERVARSIGQ